MLVLHGDTLSCGIIDGLLHLAPNWRHAFQMMLVLMLRRKVVEALVSHTLCVGIAWRHLVRWDYLWLYPTELPIVVPLQVQILERVMVWLVMPLQTLTKRRVSELLSLPYHATCSCLLKLVR